MLAYRLLEPLTKVSQGYEDMEQGRLRGRAVAIPEELEGRTA
jgi:hypothetical protein